MNIKRKEQILQIKADLAGLLSRLEELREEELEAFINMPESLRTAERGEIAANWYDVLYQGCSSLEDTINEIERVSEL